MGELEMEKNRKMYIDGLKGLACFLVMLGHYTGIYKYAQGGGKITNVFLECITSFPISIITEESFWLYLFFVISGYLLSVNRAEDELQIIDIFRKSIIRFFRLAIPIFGASIIILIIQYIIGFHNKSLEVIVENKWIQSFYHQHLTVYDAIKEPFRVLFQGNSFFNSPFWCLKNMFLSSIIIYILNYLCKYIIHKWRGCFFTLILGITVILEQPIIFSCLLGAVCGFYEESISHCKKWLYVVGIFMPVVVYMWDIANLYVYGVAFSLFLAGVLNLRVLQNLFSIREINGVGKISWGIYAFHWPIYNSIGMCMIVQLFGKCNNSILFVIVINVCIIITLLIAILDLFTVERLSGMVCRKIDIFFRKVTKN